MPEGGQDFFDDRFVGEPGARSATALVAVAAALVAVTAADSAVPAALSTTD